MVNENVYNNLMLLRIIRPILLLPEPRLKCVFVIAFSCNPHTFIGWDILTVTH